MTKGPKTHSTTVHMNEHPKTRTKSNQKIFAVIFKRYGTRRRTLLTFVARYMKRVTKYGMEAALIGAVSHDKSAMPTQAARDASSCSATYRCLYGSNFTNA